MNKKNQIRWISAVMILLLLVTAIGCTTEIALSYLGTGCLGYLIGYNAAPTVTQTECYLNGELVDCAELSVP